MSFTFVVETAAFLAGLLLGSFLNVCIVRLPYHESVVHPRSHCPSCLFPIRWYDNVPLVSWIVLRARCRKCFQPISWRYPAIELATGLWFACTAAIALHAEPSPQTAILSTGAAILGFLLIGLLVMDWQTHILPDAFTLTGIAIGFVLTCIQAAFLPPGAGDIHMPNAQHISSVGSNMAHGDIFMTGPEALVLGRVVAVVLAASILLLFRFGYKVLRGQEGMGLGDAKLMAMIAAFLGFWPAVLALFLGVIACAVYAVVLLARKRATAASHLPLGSFLAAGGLAAALLSTPIIAWYANLLR